MQHGFLACDNFDSRIPTPHFFLCVMDNIIPSHFQKEL